MKKEKIIEGLKMALQTELNGIQFYKMAAEKTVDEKGKQVFNILSNDEIKHFNILQKNYSSLIKSDKWAASISLGKSSVFEGESPIFSEELKSRIKEKHFEVAALSIGALLESNSIDFYRKMKECVDNSKAKKLFSELQEWEEGHLEAITKQLDLIKEEYWAEQHFTPLF